MFHVMFLTFFAAGIAYLSAQFADVGSAFTLPRHCIGGQSAHRRTIEIQRNTFRHHLYIVFLKARRCAVIARHCAFVARFNTAFILAVPHVKSPYVKRRLRISPHVIQNLPPNGGYRPIALFT